jgi:hypothetical protein
MDVKFTTIKNLLLKNTLTNSDYFVLEQWCKKTVSSNNDIIQRIRTIVNYKLEKERHW